MTRRTIWLAVVLCLSGPAWAASSGQVVDPDGVPIAGAQVCELVTDDKPAQCVVTGDTGLYRIETKRRGLLVRARSYVSTTVESGILAAPVTLRRAAVLRVTVVDAASQKPLGGGRVTINTPSGQRIGDSVPFNAAGVRVSTLAPGPVFVRAEADGYQPGGPLAVDLVAGSETAVTVEMIKRGASPPRP